YDSAGRLYRTRDNKDRIKQTNFDLAGRKTALIENYIDGAANEAETDTDRTTQWLYDSAGRLSTLRALNPRVSDGNSGTNLVDNEDTKYLYESLINGSWATSTIYPDSSDATSAGTDQVKV